MMNPFAHRVSLNPQVAAVSVFAIILGYMISTAWITNESRFGSRDADQRERLALGTIDQQDKVRQQSEEIARLQAQLTKLQNAVGKDESAGRLLNQSLQELKLFAGLTEVRGPGIMVTLRDGPAEGSDSMLPTELVIHDRDVLKVVNELWSAGAEAIAVNKIRVSARTSFRCVGPTILVDDNKIGTPVVIQAIGNSEQLKTSIEMPGGIWDEIRQTDPRMITVEEVSKMDLPAFTGRTGFKIGEAVVAK